MNERAPGVGKANLIVEGLIDIDSCAHLCGEMASSRLQDASVYSGKDKAGVDIEYRRTSMARVGQQSAASVNDRLTAILPKAAEYFGVPLKGIQTPQFLVYKVGDYFTPHTDDGSMGSYALPGPKRRVSCSIVLNDQGSLPGCFEGGDLLFHDLPEGFRIDRALDDPARVGKTRRPSLKTGAAILFPSGLCHEVRPVTRGVRYAIVAWYF